MHPELPVHNFILNEITSDVLGEGNDKMEWDEGNGRGEGMIGYGIDKCALQCSAVQCSVV